MKSAQDQAAKATEATIKTATKQFEDATAIGRGNVEAMVQCSTIMAKGCEEISKNLWNWMQSTVEHGMATSKQALAVKTLRELVDLQTNFVKEMMDKSLNETTRITAISTRVTSQAIEPINQRVSEVVENFQTSKAA
jgi:phasin family protein